MVIKSQKEECIVEPYSKLALIYDNVMSHVDYQRWSKYILKIVKKWCLKSTTILDISCGTGSLILTMQCEDLSFYGFDNSFHMIKIAREKLKPYSEKTNIFQSNMISFYLKKKVDVVICNYDSINYLMNFYAWRLLFDRVNDVLNKDGIFIFDICTEKNSLKFFDNYREKNGNFDYEYIRESSYDQKKKIHKNKFKIEFYSEKNIFVEVHKQKIYLIKDVKKFISSTSFQLIGAFDGFTFKQANEQSLRAHFVLMKR